MAAYRSYRLLPPTSPTPRWTLCWSLEELQTYSGDIVEEAGKNVYRVRNGKLDELRISVDYIEEAVRNI